MLIILICYRATLRACISNPPKLADTGIAFVGNGHFAVQNYAKKMTYANLYGIFFVF